MSEQEKPMQPTMPDLPGTRPSIIVNLTPESRRLIDEIARQGLFGASPGEVAERLLHEKLREVVKEGWLGPPGQSDGRTRPLFG